MRSHYIILTFLVVIFSSFVLADTSNIPLTGTKISGGFLTPGDAFLTIKNSMDEHAAFIVTKGGTKNAIVSYFIRKGDNYSIQGIPIGIYNFYYELGISWDEQKKVFTDGRMALFADNSGINPNNVNFDSLTAGYELTLYGVSNGNAKTISVDRKSFPKI